MISSPPVVAIVGRPNTGKSLLFNRLCRRRAAIVHNAPGMTLDYLTETAAVAPGVFVRFIDTGGVHGEENQWQKEILQGMQAALRRADAVLLIADAKAGAHHGDRAVLSELRRNWPKLPRLFLVNKAEGRSAAALADFYELGEEFFAVSAKRGDGLMQLRRQLAIMFSGGDSKSKIVSDVDSKSDSNLESELESESEPELESKTKINSQWSGFNFDDGLPVAIIGRPNAGKSTLLNRFLREDRVLVSAKPGTTRDNIQATLSAGGDKFLLMDTAGMGRRRADSEREKLTVSAARNALQQAAAVFLLFDMGEGPSRQDKRLAAMVAESGGGAVLVGNKSDKVPPAERNKTLRKHIANLAAGFDAPAFAISANGQRVPLKALLAAAKKAAAAAQSQFSTARLNRALAAAVSPHPPPMSGGVRPKLRFAHQGGRAPLRIVIHGGGVARIGDDYRRYLASAMARELDVHGAPLHLDFRAEENPYV